MDILKMLGCVPKNRQNKEDKTTQLVDDPPTENFR